MSKNLDKYLPIKPNDALPLKGEKENITKPEKHQENAEMAEEGGDEPHTPVNENPPPLPKTPVKQ
jgi:hypothetical protein